MIGHPELAHDARFRTLGSRRDHADELDGWISSWSAPLDPRTAATALQQAGVPAEAVLHIDGAFHDSRQLGRGLFVHFPHPEVGDRPLCGPPWRASRSPMVTDTGAPCLGADTRAVLTDWLGLSPEAIDELAAAGVLR